MELKNFVKIYDEVLPWQVVSKLLKFVNFSDKEFQKAAIGGNKTSKVDFDIRKTFNLDLNNLSNSLTNVHWYCLLTHAFETAIKNYIYDVKIQIPIKSIITVQILKYQNKGFYTWHTDHFADNPRTLSCILLLNNDYEGGNLCFRNPDSSGEWEVEVKPNRMIIWPSNFLYPHTVKPVTKGRRYSVVAWAL